MACKIQPTISNLLFTLLVLLCHNVNTTIGKLQVVAVVGGGSVVNASTPLVVMDCQYIIPQGQEAGLVVKWFKDDNPRPVYQWIVGSKPQALGILRSRLDLQYQSSPDPLKAHSALAFVSPSTEVSGDYTCRVATYQDEGVAKGSLVVYTPASGFNFKMSRPSRGQMVIACTATGVSPEPGIDLYRRDSGTTRRSPMQGRLQRDFNALSRLHSASIESEVRGLQLIGETEFDCELTIPGTEYIVTETIVYYPGVSSSSAESVSGRSTKTGYSSRQKSAAASSCNTLHWTSAILLALLSWICIVCNKI